jgi:predicted MFS family arabinose efflux permease
VRPVLKLPAYCRLLSAYTLTQLAWWVGTLALAVLVYRRTGSALASAAFFLCAQFVPALLSPALVARIDQRAARRVLPELYAAEAFAFAALTWVSSHFFLGTLLVIVALDGVIALAGRALIRAATVAVTAPAGLLREGNALFNGAFSICFFVGPALGAVVADAEGTNAALLLAAGMFAVIALILATARGLPPAMAEDRPKAGRLRAAISQAREDPPVRVLLGLQAAALVFFTISVPVEVVFAEQTLGSGRGGYAALLSVWGAGTVLGSAVYARWRALPGRTMIVLGCAAMGAGLLVMAAAPTLALAICGAALAGTGNGVEAVAARTTLQEQVDPEWMALIMSLNESLFQAMPGVGIVLGGAVTAAAGTRAALTIAGAGALVVAVAGWTLLGETLAIRRSRSPATAARR